MDTSMLVFCEQQARQLPMMSGVYFPSQTVNGIVNLIDLTKAYIHMLSDPKDIQHNSLKNKKCYFV